MAGPSVVVRLPSVKTEEEFNRLLLLHLTEDQLVPGSLHWQGYRTSLGEQKPDSKTRTLSAEFDYMRIFNRSTGMGRLVIAFFNREEYDKSAVDLYLTSVVGPPYVKLGETFVHSIAIKNAGGTGLSANDVVVHSSMNGARFVSGTATQGTCPQSINSTPDIVCELGKVDFGKTVTMTLTVKSEDLGMGRPDEKEFVFSTINAVRSREKDYSPENNNYQNLGTIVRRP